MPLVERYIFRTAGSAFLICLVALTGVIWITQALRELDLVTGKGQTILIFLYVTMLGMPALIMIVAPVALFAAIVYALNKLNGDSELIVMSASGIPPRNILRPFLTLTLVVSVLIAAITLYLMPASFRILRELVTKIRADVVTKIVQEGKFVSLEQGLVFHYRAKGPGGTLEGILIQDRRDPKLIATYLADRGLITEANGTAYFVLDNGSLQRQDARAQENAIVTFKRYVVDLDQFAQSDGKIAYKPREWTTMELLTRKSAGDGPDPLRGRFRAELHERFVNPLYPLAMLAIAFAALGQAQTTRQGRGKAMAIAITGVAALRVAGFAASSLVVRSPAGIAVLYAVPLVAIVLSALAFNARLRAFTHRRARPVAPALPASAVPA